MPPLNSGQGRDVVARTSIPVTVDSSQDREKSAAGSRRRLLTPTTLASDSLWLLLRLRKQRLGAEGRLQGEEEQGAPVSWASVHPIPKGDDPGHVGAWTRGNRKMKQMGLPKLFACPNICCGGWMRECS